MLYMRVVVIAFIMQIKGRSWGGGWQGEDGGSGFYNVHCGNHHVRAAARQVNKVIFSQDSSLVWTLINGRQTLSILKIQAAKLSRGHMIQHEMSGRCEEEMNRSPL